MRDKEAIEGERKNLARNLEKQSKAMERLMDGEKNLTAQVVSPHRSRCQDASNSHLNQSTERYGEAYQWVPEESRDA